MNQHSSGPSRIAIALSRTPLELPDYVLVLFVPSKDTWNDLALQVHAEVGIRTSSGPFEWVSGYLAFKNEATSRKYAEQLINSANAQWVAIDRVRIAYASMLRNVRAYQQLVRIIGIENAEQIAVAACDVAFARAQKKTLERWPAFTATPIFTRVFMRFSETAFAYENAGVIFRGQTLDAEDARQDFTAIIKLGNTFLDYRFRFQAGRISENRISVVIGRNGLGKTATLIALGRNLLDRNARGARISPRPSFNQLLVYAHSRSLARFKIPSRNPRSASQKTFSLDPTKTAASQIELTSQLATMARESDLLDNPLRTLVEVVRSEFQGLSIWVPVSEEGKGQDIQGANGKFLPIDRFWLLGEQARLDRNAQIDTSRPLLFLGPAKEPRNLSLGQDVFISFAFHAISRSGPASVFLIDEPENFLHPNLISRFVRLLHNILQRTKSIAIIATHSPYVVREVQRSQVHVLSPGLGIGETVVEHPRLQTFGANVSSISDYLFGDDMVDHLYVQLLNAAELQGSPPETWIDNFKEELSLDALMLLRQQREKIPGDDS